MRAPAPGLLGTGTGTGVERSAVAASSWSSVSSVMRSSVFGPRRRPVPWGAPDDGRLAYSGSRDVDGHGYGVGDDVEHGRAPSGLLDDLAELLGGRVALDHEAD